MSDSEFVARYLPDRWRTVRVANGVLAVVGVVLTVVGIVALSSSTARGLAVGIVGLALVSVGVGNNVLARRRFAPAGLVALGLTRQAVTLPNCGTLPWEAVDSLEFSYRPEGGKRKPLDLLFFNDDRNVVVHLNRSRVPVEFHAALLRQDSDVFYHGLETAYVSALDGGEQTYLELLHATHRYAPPGFTVKVTTQDPAFKDKVAQL